MAQPDLPSLSDSADAASALTARGVGTSVLETVASRVSSDRGSVAQASAALASWSRAFAGPGLASAVLSVHERSSEERAEERARREIGRERTTGPVERGDWSWWLRTDFPRLGGEVDTLSLDGSAQILHLGVERSIPPPGVADRFSKVTSPGGEWFVGAGLGLASASVDDPTAGMSLRHSTTLLYPYLGYRDDRKLAYASIGGGVGTNTFRHPTFQSEAAEQDALFVFAGLGGALVIGGRPDRVELLVRASALGTLANTNAGPVLDTSTVAAHRLRLGLDARHARRLGGGIVSPFGSLGILYDAGDGPSGTAVEVEAGTRFDWRRFSFSVRAWALLATSDGLDRTVGLSGDIRYSPGGSGRGFFLTLSPTYGADPRQAEPLERLLTPDSAEPTSGSVSSLFGLSAEAGYTFSATAVPGLVTVAAGVRQQPEDNTDPDIARARIRYQGRRSLEIEAKLDQSLKTGGDIATPSVALHLHWSF